MTTRVDAPGADDPHNLGRFVEAQGQYPTYADALAEIRAGRKVSHWIWYIFPQAAGLGSSGNSRYFGISGLDEAWAYLDHPVLGPRLREIAGAALAVEGRAAHEIFGSMDSMKLRSCATLFDCVAEPGSVFERLLATYFEGRRDERTLRLVGRG